MIPAMNDAAPTIAFADFERVDIRAGRIVRAEKFPEARKAAFKLWIDFGPLGTRTSSAQITVHYEPSQLIGRSVVAVVNFAPRRVGPFTSDVLTLGVDDGSGAVVLVVPDKAVPPGQRVF